MAIGVVPCSAMLSITSFSAFLKSFSAIASRTSWTIVFGAGAGGAGVCASAAALTNRDKIRAVIVRVMKMSILSSVFKKLLCHLSLLRHSCRMRRALLCLSAAVLIWCASSPEAQERAVRARDLGIPFHGALPGQFNAITDVSGVEVGFTTLISGEGKLV